MIKNRLLNLINNPLVIGLVFSSYIIVVRFLIFPKYSYLLAGDFELIQSFIEWFGVAYGLFIALVLVTVWSQFDTADREFDRESDAIFMLYQAANQIEGKKLVSLRGKIIRGIKTYVSHVNMHYLYEHQKPLIRISGDAILDEIRGYIGKLIHKGEIESLASELVQKFNEAVDLRGDRIYHSKQRMPAPVWAISLASSILWIVPFYGLNFKNDLLAIALVGGVTIIVVAILVIIKDLDDPFDGTWMINVDEWKLLAEKVEPKPTLLFVYDISSSRLDAVRVFISKIFSKQLCGLYSLFDKKEKDSFFDDLSELAYVKIYYKDEYEKLYGEIDSYPSVMAISHNKAIKIIDNHIINQTSKLSNFKKIIQMQLMLLKV